jgi:2-dehydropantoate 2-reductase
MKILILGAGAIGGYYGARLVEAGADVTFLVRKQRQRQIEEGGLQVKSSLGDFSGPVRSVTATRRAEDFDVVVLACKAYDLHAAAEAIAPAMASGATLLPFQNGLGVYDFLDGNFGRRQVLGGVAYIATSLFSDGVIRHLDDGDSVVIGPRAVEATEVSKELYALFAKTRGEREFTTSADQALWDKWVLLSAGAAVCCLMRGTLKQILQNPLGESLLIRAVDECASVAAASGFPLSAESLKKTMAFLLDEESDWAASMMRDMARNRPRLEHDAIVGDMHKFAVRLGLSVPVIETAHAHLQVYAFAHRQNVSENTSDDSDAPLAI